ncbi:MAG: DUF5050 domain-containing protein, partial [Clostridia bacterium]|nr:DUF5050 domain-containing protein [Clostridia bacterium]
AAAEQAVKNTPRACIYRVNLKTGGAPERITTRKAFTVTVMGDRIFYTTPTLKDVELRVIGIDSTGDKKLMTFSDGEAVTYATHGVAVAHDDQIVYFDYATLTKTVYDTGAATGMKMSDHYLYYFNQREAGMKRLEFATGNIETLCDKIGKIFYADDELVFFGESRIPYRLNANTLELNKVSEAYYRSMLLNRKHETILALASDTEDKGLYSQPMNNTAGKPVEEGGNRPRVKLHQNAISAYCADDDFIYFVEEETGNIYRMTFEGTQKTVLGKINSVCDTDGIEAVGDRLILFDAEDSGCAYVLPTDGSGTLTLLVGEEA